MEKVTLEFTREEYDELQGLVVSALLSAEALQRRGPSVSPQVVEEMNKASKKFFFLHRYTPTVTNEIKKTKKMYDDFRERGK